VPGLRRATAASLVAVTIAIGAGSGSVGATAPIAWSAARLHAYTATYRITRNGTGAVVGSERVQVTLAGAVARLRQTLTVGGEVETDSLTLAARGLALKTLAERLAAAGQVVSIDATARGRALAVRADVAGKREAFTMAAPAGSPWIENEALLVTLAAVPLRPGEESIVDDLVVQHDTIARLGLAVGKRTTVRTGAGTFTCLAVTMASLGGNQTVWVSTGRAPVMVRYANAATTFTLTALRP